MCVSGSGAVAMSLALALSRGGWRVPLGQVAPGSARGVDRHSHLCAQCAVHCLLERLRVWAGR